jgi:hypothetical protein
MQHLRGRAILGASPMVPLGSLNMHHEKRDRPKQARAGTIVTISSL